MTRTYQFNKFVHNQIQTTAATGDSLRNLASASPLPCAGTCHAMPRSAHLSYLTRARVARSEQRRSSTRTAYRTSPPIQAACRLISSPDHLLRARVARSHEPRASGYVSTGGVRRRAGGYVRLLLADAPVGSNRGRSPLPPNPTWMVDLGEWTGIGLSSLVPVAMFWARR